MEYFYRELNLRNPIYNKTACYGHFGRPDFTWEIPKKLTIRPEIEEALGTPSPKSKRSKYSSH